MFHFSSRSVISAVMLFLLVFLTLLLTPLLVSVDHVMGTALTPLRPTIAMLWLCVLAFWLSVLFSSQWRVLSAYIKLRASNRKAIKILSLLSSSQKEILKRLYGQGKIHTCTLSSDNPQVSILEHERILLRTDQFGSNGLPYYRIAPWVILYLQDNPNYLE